MITFDAKNELFLLVKLASFLFQADQDLALDMIDCRSDVTRKIDDWHIRRIGVGQKRSNGQFNGSFSRIDRLKKITR